MGKDLKGNPLPPGIMQRKSGIYRGRFYYKGETYTKDNADLKKLVQEMEDLRYEVKHGLKGNSCYAVKMELTECITDCDIFLKIWVSLKRQ